MTEQEIKAAAYEEGLKAGLQKATELIEEGRTLCQLNDKEECSQCLSQLVAALNS